MLRGGTTHCCSLKIGGKEVKGFSQLKSIGDGVGPCPEERKEEGIAGRLILRENSLLSMQTWHGRIKYFSLKERYEIAEKGIKLLNIATPSADQIVKNLSGGNQQKVILARWLVTNPRLLILNVPTRGIDVDVRPEIQKQVLSLDKKWKSCLFISSELEEVLRD